MNKNQSDSYASWTWIVALILALVLVWLFTTGKDIHNSCCSNNATVVAEEPTTKTEEEVPPPTPAVTEAFSFSASAADFTSNGDPSNIAWFNNTNALKNILDGNLHIEGDEYAITLTGTVSSEVKRLQKSLDAESFFGSDVMIDNQITVGAEPSNIAPVPVAKLYFDSGYHRLPDNGPSILAASIALLKESADKKAIISGYHDTTGDLASNQALAKKRAQSVYDALVAAGINADNIEMRKPVSTDGGGDLSEARRVEVSVE